MSRVKRVLKRLLRPFAGPVYRRIDVRIQHAFNDASVQTLREATPSLLNLAASYAAAQREARRRQQWLEERVAALESRMELVRQEILFEVGNPGQTETRENQAPRIVNAGKVTAAADDLRLNLGCGHIPLDGFINVDARELDGVDIVADVLALPFEQGSVAAIHSAHLLEHFPIEKLKRTALPYWYSLLEPGGRFTAIVSDAETMLAEYVAGRMPFEDLRRVTYGEQEYTGNFHFNMFSQQSLCDVLRDAGFTDVTLGESGRRNVFCYEMEVRAVKPVRSASPERAGAT